MAVHVGVAIAAFAGVVGISAARARDASTSEANGTGPLVSLSGAHSRIVEQTYARISSAKEFQDVYMRHLGEDPERYDEFYNPHGVPMIDFDRCIVVAVFQGKSWNSAGVRVRQTLEEPQRLTIRFSNQSYQTAGPDGGGQRVTPFGIFILPRTHKELVLEEDVRIYINEQPKWKEVARFPASDKP